MDALLTAKDVKNLLNCSLPLVYKMADRGQIPCIRWNCPGEEGKREKTVVRFQKNDLMAFIEQNKKVNQC
jgi:hypothetical protein